MAGTFHAVGGPEAGCIVPGQSGRWRTRRVEPGTRSSLGICIRRRNSLSRRRVGIGCVAGNWARTFPMSPGSHGREIFCANSVSARLVKPSLVHAPPRNDSVSAKASRLRIAIKGKRVVCPAKSGEARAIVHGWTWARAAKCQAIQRLRGSPEAAMVSRAKPSPFQGHTHPGSRYGAKSCRVNLGDRTLHFGLKRIRSLALVELVAAKGWTWQTLQGTDV